MMVVIQSVKAQVAIAALHHEGNVTIYSSAQAAIDNSVAGDTIYLSEGIFGGFKVEKPIAIIGAGRTTMISSDITLGKTTTAVDSIAPGLLLSGLNIVQDVKFYNTIEGARITQCIIGGTCSFLTTYNYCSFDNIEILMSQIGTLSPNGSTKGLSVVASKITYISSGGADEGSVTILNCNIARDESNKINFVNCIIPTLGSGVYANCLYSIPSSASVIYDCYQNDFTLDDDLNCSLSDEQLKAAGYLGSNGTWVGITGGEVKFSLVTPVAQVVDHSLEVDQVERKLKVTLKLGNK
jgi:hypothetical protein